MHDVARELTRIGMSTREAASKAEGWLSADRALDAAGAHALRWSAWVPGRIEIFGKHTDYAGGRSLLCAVEKGFVVRAGRRGDSVVRAIDVASGVSHTIELGASRSPDRPPSWAPYVEAVVRRLARNFPAAMRGVDLAFSSDLPIAAGMSSSSALLIATFVVIAEANGLRDSPEYLRRIQSPDDLAAYLACVENGQAFGDLRGDAGVGTLGGSEDHVAIICSTAGHALQYAFAPARREGAYRVPAGHLFVLASSGVTAEKTAGARARYNRAAIMVRHLLDEWNRTTGRTDRSLAAAAGSSADAPERLRTIAAAARSTTFDGDALVSRLDQFLLESFEIVPAAGVALEMGDWTTLGALSARSQQAAEDWLGNQEPETVALARSARELGAVAASAFGAGFGGSVWALAPEDGAAELAQRWSARYHEEFPRAASRAEFFVSRAGPGAHLW